MYRRLVLKLSGQAIAGSNEFGFSSDRLTHLANEVIALRATGVQVAVIVGGGNVFRGDRADDWGIDRVEADNIGMLGTMMNAVLLRGRLSALGAHGVRLMTTIPIDNLAEPYIRLRALATWRRARSSSSPVAMASRSPQPTTPPSSVRSNWKPMRCSSPRTAPTACTTPTRTSSRPPPDSTI